MNDQPVNFVDFQQRSGAAIDAIDEALNSYREYMLDDDYEAQRALGSIMTRLAERRDSSEPKLREAAQAVYDYLINLEDSDVWEAAQDAMDKPMSDAADVVLAALREMIGSQREAESD